MAFLFCAALSFASCGIIKRQSPEHQDLNVAVIEASKKPMPPEKTKQLLSEVGSNWLYGQGIGETAINIGTAVIFPPYLIYLLGNAALSLGGYEPVTVAAMLPEEAGREWSATYDSIASGPGKFAAAVAGEEYRTKELAREKIKEAISQEAPVVPSDHRTISAVPERR